MTLNSISKLIIPCAHKMRIVLDRPQSLWPLENVKAGRLPITNQLYNHMRRTSHLTVSFSIAATVQRLLPAGVTAVLGGDVGNQNRRRLAHPVFELRWYICWA